MAISHYVELDERAERLGIKNLDTWGQTWRSFARLLDQIENLQRAQPGQQDALFKRMVRYNEQLRFTLGQQAYRITCLETELKNRKNRDAAARKAKSSRKARRARG